VTDGPLVRVPTTRPRPHQAAAFVAVLVSVSWALGAFAQWPWVSRHPERAHLRISVKDVTPPVTRASALSPEELAKIPAHMRPSEGARTVAGRRSDATLSVALDGRTVLTRAYRPTGLRHDGPVYGYEELVVPPGRHELTVGLDAGGDTRRFTGPIDVAPGRAPLLELWPGSGWQYGPASR
jgi:hypothetical protein